MINTDADLIKTVSEINQRIQAVHDYLGDRNHDNAKIRFPRGYLRTCATHRHKYSFLEDKTLQSNIAYAKMTTDIFRWLLNRTDISMVANEMIIKQGISIIGNIVESIVKEVLRGKPGGGNKQNFKKKVETLVANQEITPELKTELDWLWDVRNNVHLMLLEEREIGKYKIKDYNRAVKALQSLRVALGGKP
ncbi:hypothetical protein ACQ259_16855 [Stutzerimonas stutzeri]|jgi:hypothetical protein